MTVATKTSPMTTPAPFRPEPPMRTARRYTDAELAARATPDQVNWLYDHPLLWMRALAQVGRDVETHIAKAHRDLAALRPTPGADQTAYLAAKRRHDEQTTARLHFRGIVTRRTEEVASLVGPDPANRLMVGNLIHILLHIAALADDDDIEAVKSAALGLAEKFANQTRQP